MPPRLALAFVPLAALLITGFAFVGPPPRPDGPGIPDYVPPRGYVAHRATGPMVIDGRLDEPTWQQAAWSDDFVDIEGARRPAPRHRTRVKMAWDDLGLYLAARLEEPHVWGTLTAHDSVIFQDNDFEVFLDPDGDGHLYAELELNALNTTWDLLLSRPYKDQGRALDAWEIAGLKTAVAVEGTRNDPRDTDVGWTVEIFWPWKGLKELTTVPVPPRDGDQWRINFSRVEWDHVIEGGAYRKVPKRPEHNWVWSPQHQIDMHRPEWWGYLQFSGAAPGTVPFRPDPAGPAKHLLHRVYYAQHKHRKTFGGYAPTLAALGLPDLPTAGRPSLAVAGSAFEAGVTAAGRRWRIREDARVWGD